MTVRHATAEAHGLEQSSSIRAFSLFINTVHLPASSVTRAAIPDNTPAPMRLTAIHVMQKIIARSIKHALMSALCVITDITGVTQKRERAASNNIMTNKINSALLLSLLLIIVPLPLHAGDIKGNFYVSDYYSVDSNDYDLHILTSRLKLDKPEDEKKGYYFKLDGRVRKKISNGDIPEYKFYELWMGYKFPGEKLNVIAGRQYIDEMYDTSVDGLNIKYSFKKGLGIGVFGGLAPDKYDYSFNADFKSAGLYSYLDQDSYKLRLGYENINFKGKTDREYFSLKFFSDLKNKVKLNVISSASINQLTHDIDIENINTNFLYNYSKDFRLGLFYNYYRAIKYFESSKQFFDRIDLNESYFLDTNSQTRTGLRVDYRLFKGLSVYASAAYQKRNIDHKDSLRLTGGLRKYDLLGFDISGRYTHIDNFTSRNNEFNVELSRYLFNKFDVSVYASHEKEELELENRFTKGLLTYGTSVYWLINKNYYASMFVEHYDEDDYYNTSLFTQAGYRF